MFRRIVVVLVPILCLGGCSQSADSPAVAGAPLAPTAVLSPSQAAPADVEVPFHSEVVWSKVEGSDVALCVVPPPEGQVYLMRNTLSGTAVSTHLGNGTFLGHTCVYGTPAGGPAGWLMDVSFTAANGDILLATAEFIRWTGTPGKSVAIESVTFQDGGTGRFQFAKGTGTCYVNALAKTATYEASLRYAKKAK